MRVETDAASMMAPIVVVGRVGSASGLGTHLSSLIQAIGRAVPVVLLPIDDESTCIALRSLDATVAGVIVTESPVNNPDLVAALVDIGGRVRRAVVFAWDSDAPDPVEVLAINAAFDHVWTTAPTSRSFADSFSPRLSWRQFPLSVDMRWPNALSLSRGSRWPRRIKIGSVGAFHARKQHELLVEAAARVLAAGHDIELLIHSNLDQGEYARVLSRAKSLLPPDRYFITNDDKDAASLALLYSVLDIYVSASRGESFNIPLRQALAAGIPAIAFDIPGHADLRGSEGLTLLPAAAAVPARYAERDGRICGVQWTGSCRDLELALELQIQNLSTGKTPDPRRMAEEGLRWDPRVRREEVWQLLLECGFIRTPLSNWAPPGISRSNRAEEPRPVLIPAFDAGLLANFNVLASHLRWWPSTRWLPDWSIEAVRKYATGPLMSYCYATPEDGNIITRLFKFPDSLIDLDELERDPRTTIVVRSYNAMLDPYLTYVHPEKLYRSAEFGSWRRRMHEVVQEFLWPEDEILRRVDQIIPPHSDIPILGLHVRHPSHAIEQPSGALPSLDDFVLWADQWLVENDGMIFLATDQDQVVERFNSEFGTRLIMQTAARESCEVSAYWMSLPEEEKFKEGHQFQHQMTRLEERHSIELAREVLVDTWSLARCSLAIHAVSNVATAAAMVNPDLPLLFARPGLTVSEMLDLRRLTQWFPTC